MAPTLSKILYAEDEPDIQVIVKIALENLGGFQVKVCNSGDEALQAAAEFAPDLFLLDVMMPKMDGPSTLKALREIPQFSKTPVIFMTAKAQINEVNNYMGLGIADIITKPFDPLTITDTIKNVWEKHHSQLSNAVEEQLAVLRKSYSGKLKEKIEELIAVEKQIQAHSGETAIQDLYQISHSLSGSCAMFGFPTISEKAHEIETIAKSIVKEEATLTDESIAQIGTLVSSLHQAFVEL